VTASETSAMSCDRDGTTAVGWRSPSEPGHRLGSGHTHAPGSGDLYGRALLSRVPDRGVRQSGWRVRDGDGVVRPIDAALDRWLGPCDDADRTVLDRCTGATLDVGCGPGRLAAELRTSGVLAVGIDVNDVALQMTHDRGGAAVRADLFGRVPGQVRWGTLVLLDGNLGIGGDPARLLARCAELLVPGGQLLVEVEAPGEGRGAGRRRLENTTEVGPWFPWATLDVAGVTAAAASTPMVLRESWSAGDRWFAALTV
jgi:SAM-dependent methyltransferase